MKTTTFAHLLSLTGLMFHLGGCSTLPPGTLYPRTPSTAYAGQGRDRVSVLYGENDRQEGDLSAFRMLSVGVDGFATRMQQAQAAKHSLDLQYFIFTADSTGLLLSEAVLAAVDRGVRVRILVDDGPTSRGTGQKRALSRYGNHGLHRKLLVFDRSSMYAGSMNFDKRSRLLNTEIGVIIDSPELAAQAAARFEAMTQRASAYAVSLRPREPGKPSLMVWHTLENEKPVEYTREPSNWYRRLFEVTPLSLLPIEREL
jgi:phosphatidylserine/phosphatidylglycerophosphate/cardiolipin synthase-like enzyme